MKAWRKEAESTIVKKLFDRVGLVNTNEAKA